MAAIARRLPGLYGRLHHDDEYNDKNRDNYQHPEKIAALLMPPSSRVLVSVKLMANTTSAGAMVGTAQTKTVAGRIINCQLTIPLDFLVLLIANLDYALWGHEVVADDQDRCKKHHRVQHGCSFHYYATSVNAAAPSVNGRRKY
jgi:hypothetical protein